MTEMAASFLGKPLFFAAPEALLAEKEVCGEGGWRIKSHL